MGLEQACKLDYRGRTLTGTAHLETGYLLFRGESRLRIPLKDLKEVEAVDGILKLQLPVGTASFRLGKVAEKWAQKIIHPPSLAEKSGVKAGMTFRLEGDFDDRFLDQLRERKAVAASSGAKGDLIFFAAGSASDLEQVRKLRTALKPKGALWIVYPKSIQRIREIDVLEAGRAAGLKDTRVASFSSTHTALRFVFPAKAGSPSH